ncbi:glycosyltransferase [Polynucleobacter paneuropaeus]|nr:glycosyltransferase [Polynucleobacter paneuropaeus]
MKLAIITVCFNAEKTIRSTLKSIISQKFKDYEFIVVDGGSTDNTLNILNEYKNYIDIKISEPDQGIYHAMNKAIALSSSEWLVFMNADDVFYSDDVLKEIFSFNLNKYNLVIGDYNDGRGDRKALNLNKNTLLYGMPTTHQSIIFRKKDYFYNLKYKIAGDYDYLWQYFNSEDFNTFYYDKKISKININGISREKRILNSLEFYKISQDYSPSPINFIYFILRIISNELAIRTPYFYEYVKKFTRRNRGR